MTDKERIDLLCKQFKYELEIGGFIRVRWSALVSIDIDDQHGDVYVNGRDVLDAVLAREGE